MVGRGLTATIIFEGQSLNFDEGYGGNLSILKKFHRGSGETFSYSSRQSLRYSIFLQGVREFKWEPSKVEEAGKGDKKVMQLISEISTSEESDLFGYMRTNVKIDDKENAAAVSRTSPVRLLPAIALEPFSSDMEMLTNKYQADKKQLQSSIANFENQRTLYRYSICIDLHRIGSERDKIGTRFSLNSEEKEGTPFAKVAENFEHKLRNQSITYEDRTKRVNQLLEVVGRLYRDIRGRREDLKPLFIVGGVYDTFNPFFENIVNVEFEKGKRPRINTYPLKEMLNAYYTTAFDATGEENAKSVKSDAFIGIRDRYFANEISEFRSLYLSNNAFSDDHESKEHVGSPEHVITKLKEKVKQYYQEEKEQETKGIASDKTEFTSA